MKTLLIISISLISINLFSQDLENKICNCIGNNFKEINIDYYQVLEDIEDKLILSGIIQESNQSRIDQIEKVSHIGIIENLMTVENILFDNLGLETLKYCIILHTYSSDEKRPSRYFRLIRKIELASQNIQYPLNTEKLKKFRMEAAKAILKYQDNDGNSKLWKLIQLQYLHLFSQTKELVDPPTFVEFEAIEQDTTNTINIDVNSDNQIIFDNHQITKDQICYSIQNHIENGMGIYLTIGKRAKYILCLDVYNSIKACFQELRDKKSVELYGNTMENINPEQRKEIIRIVPVRIIETAPK